MQILWDEKRIVPTNGKPQAETFVWPKEVQEVIKAQISRVVRRTEEIKSEGSEGP